MNRSLLAAAAPLALIFASMPAYSQQVAAPKPAPVSELVKQVKLPYEQFTLKNGLRVIVHTDRKAPVVAVSVWYDVGSKHEPKGKSGFAHLFEHLMFNGSENAPGDFFAPLKEVGATNFNGTTHFDRTNYFQTVPTPALDRTLFLESDRMGWLLGAIDQAVLDEQRGVVQNEKRQNDNRPYGLLMYSVLEGLLAGNPYGHTPIGSMEDLDRASVEDVKNWFRSHYGPNNAVLVLAGDIDAKSARPLVEKYFGAIKPGPKTVTPEVPIPTLAEARTIVTKDTVPATLVTRTWAVPGFNEKDSVGLSVAAAVLGGLASSRLDTALVREAKVAVNASSNVLSFSQLGIFMVTMIVMPGVDVAVATKKLDEVVAELLAKGPTEDEVRRVVTNSAVGTIAGLESVSNKATTLASGALFSNDPDFGLKQLAALAAITPEAVRASAKLWLSRPALTVLVEPGSRPAYQEAAQVAEKPKVDAPPKVAMGNRGALPSVSDGAPLDLPDVTRTRLANGIELVYAQRTAVPISQVILSFDAGQVADPADKLGLHALTLDLLDEGSEKLGGVALAEARERLGASISTGGSGDRTYASLGSPSVNLGASLDLFADLVRNPAFAQSELDRLRATRLTGIAQELSSPEGLVGRALPGVLFGKAHPYAKSAASSGDPVAVAKLTRGDLVEFHRAWIRPDRAKLFVVSDRPLAEVKALLETRFGNWTGVGATGTKNFSASAVQSSPKIFLIDRPNSPQSQIVGAQLTALAPKADLLAYDAANEALAGDFLSRVNMDLRESKGWSYGVRGNFGWNEHLVTYSIGAPVQADKTGPAIKAILDQYQDFLGGNGVTDVELKRISNNGARQLAGRFETAGAVLSAMQSNDIRGRQDNYQETLAQKYRALTRPQLDAAARSVIDPKKFVWVVVGDAAKVKPQLDSLGLPVEVVDAASLASPTIKK